MKTYEHDEIVINDKNSPSKMLSRAFWCGFALHISLTGLIQDWLGKDEFIRYVNDNWINTHWIMWVAFSAAALSIYYSLRLRVNA